MLRNPAYIGKACFGKTRAAPRQRITRPLRLRGGVATRNSASHELPRAEWIEIPVPPIICEETYALAAERLQSNKKEARAAPHGYAKRRARLGELRQVRLRSLSDVHKVERPNHLLLSLPRFGRLAPARRTGLRLSPSSSGFAGRSGMERNCALARRAKSHTGRARSPARGRTKGRSYPAPGRSAASRSRALSKEHRAPAHGLSRKPSLA